VKINPGVFREYDIRGIVEKDLSDTFAHLLGRAYAELAKEHGIKQVAIGYDCRHSSESYARSLAEGITDEGVNACITGMGPTPQVYYALFEKGFGGGIQVTGSHNPPDMNGFKICIGKGTLYGDGIQDLRERMERLISTDKGSTKAEISYADISEEYAQNLIDNVKPHMGSRKLKVVVDAGNGVGGIKGPEVLRALGLEVIELFCEPNGDFPNHHPDPTVMEYMQDLIAKVKDSGADFGIGWDGDADRIGLIDENGKNIHGDMLLLIYARALLKEKPGATVIGDVKCSSLLFDGIKDAGGRPIVWKTGHSLMKNKLKEENGDLGGEMSGHMFFRQRFYGYDDALYASARLAEIMSNTDKTVSEMLSDLPQTFSTPEIRVNCPDNVKFKIAKAAESVFSEFEVNTIDGVRVTFENGWGLVRASNTQAVLVMRFEAGSEEDLKKYQDLVVKRIDNIKNSLEEEKRL